MLGFVSYRRVLASVCLASCTLVGCGGPSNVGQVTGNVTLDGQPLAGALVIFNPDVAGGGLTGGQSSALTDQAGNYRLRYTREDYGAETGEHRVRITTAEGGNPDADPPRPKVKERLPAKYHTKSELKATVKAGKNNIDFELESAGKNT